MNSTDTDFGDAVARLRQLKIAIDKATPESDIDTIAADVIPATVAAYAARVPEDHIAQLLDISITELHGRLRQAAFPAVGLQNIEEGDVIVEWDGQPAALLVRKRFAPLYEGGPCCLGVGQLGSDYEYNMWENTDLSHPGSAQLLLVRPSSH